ncbi:MAG: hypothetical protein D5R98_04155 [Desulfonatronovibrio sp. MSAO_Bac4]|nr:MAG: hypothetical protein D5R98_04155 [Desulfonatronovibrio sp. MSAO_Bac4]
MEAGGRHSGPHLSRNVQIPEYSAFSLKSPVKDNKEDIFLKTRHRFSKRLPINLPPALLSRRSLRRRRV